MNAPIWLVPIFALLCAVNRILQFREANGSDIPSKYLWLSKGIVDLAFVGIYIWVAIDPDTLSHDRAQAVRWLVVSLFFTNVVAVSIERKIVDRVIQWLKTVIHFRIKVTRV